MGKIRTNQKTERTNGITLIALVITIIVLLILAAISIATLTGENGILTQANKSNENTKMEEEKELINLSLLGLKDKASFTREELDNEMKANASHRKVEVTGEGPFIVKYLDTGRSYDVSNTGTIEEAPNKTIDETPEDIAGSGTEENPYRIQSIEDLVILSQRTKPEYIKANSDIYSEKIFKLETDLSFTSRNSYIDPDKENFMEIGDINQNGTTESLIVELTTGKGFIPIGEDMGPSTLGFKGTFDGQNYKIKNLYGEGFFKTVIDSTIKNLNMENVNIFGAGCEGGIINNTFGNVSLSGCIVNGKISSSGSVRWNNWLCNLLLY